MAKRIVFIHAEAIPDGMYYEDLTDIQIYYLAKTEPRCSWVYDTWEDYLNDYNSEMAPSESCCFGRVIDFSLYEQQDNGKV